LSGRDHIARRLTAQQIAGPRARDPVGVAERLLAIQGQDPRGARLAIRARTEGLSAADVDRALTDERTLLITWLNRGTLHLVRSEDYFWLHALTTPPLLTSSMRRLSQEGFAANDADRAVAVIERSLANGGPMTRNQLAQRIETAGFPAKGQAMYHILFLASLRGVLVRGPMVGRQHAYVSVRDWLGEGPPVDRDKALAELARRFLVGHGPASDRDLAKWAGLALRDARAGLSAIAAELAEEDEGLVDLAARPPPAELPPPRLLGDFDPVLLGWTSRAPLVGHHQDAIIAGSLFKPFALVRGRAAAAWTIRHGKVVIEPFDRLTRRDAAALEAESADVIRFLAHSET
jgi:hypothetical protein